jgi:uncharacterized spore protein YtfJ
MDVSETISTAERALTVKRVFGDPLTHDGITVIPVARIIGGAGGGAGQAPESSGQGEGSGFGLGAAPVGVFVIRGEQVSWQPAVDVNRVLLGALAVAVVALLTVGSWVRARVSARARS